MKKNNVIKVVVVTMILALLAGCGAKEGSDSIKIGGSGPLTGDAAVYGIDVMNAAQLAVDEINAKEGKEYFAFKMEDDAADPEKSPIAYSTLMDWGMQVSIYTVTSGAGLAVAEDYNNDRIFALTPSGSNTGLIYNGKVNYDNAFQVCFTDPNQGRASADYIAEHKLASKVAVIYRSDDDYSKSIYATFVEEAAKVGLEVVSETSFLKDDADYSAQLLEAEKNGAELVFLPIYYQPASVILTQANNSGYAPIFFGVDGMDGILGLDGFKAELAEGVYLLTPFAADATDDATVHFVTAFKEAYGTVPTQFAADAYDAVYAIYQACKAGNVTPDMAAADICDIMIDQFTTMEYPGLTGTSRWAVNGEVNKSPKAVIINNGVYVAAE